MGWSATISSAADLADYLILMDLYKTKAYPAWIEEPTLSGYSKKKLIRETMEFEVTLALMKLMLELMERDFRRGSLTKIRLLNNDPVKRDHIIYEAELVPSIAEIAGEGGWIELNAFETAVEKYVIEDWEFECGR